MREEPRMGGMSRGGEEGAREGKDELGEKDEIIREENLCPRN